MASLQQFLWVLAVIYIYILAAILQFEIYMYITLCNLKYVYRVLQFTYISRPAGLSTQIGTFQEQRVHSVWRRKRRRCWIPFVLFVLLTSLYFPLTHSPTDRGHRLLIKCWQQIVETNPLMPHPQIYFCLLFRHACYVILCYAFQSTNIVYKPIFPVNSRRPTFRIAEHEHFV